MSADVVCMSLGTVSAGEQRSRFLAVGLADQTVRIISLDPSVCQRECLTTPSLQLPPSPPPPPPPSQDTLQPLSMQALPALPESLCVVEMGGSSDLDTGLVSVGGMFLNIGMQNGVLLRTALDSVTGDLSDTRTRCFFHFLLLLLLLSLSLIPCRYLGTRPVKLFRVRMQGTEAVLAVSSRTWLSYYYQSRFHLTPLSYDVLEFASSFCSEQCPEGIVAIASNTLR